MKLFVLLSLFISLINAQFGSCDKGSDVKCARFGPNFCCAYVDIKSSKDQLNGYWCSDRQYASEEYDFGGYTGSILCSSRGILGLSFSIITLVFIGIASIFI